MAFYFPSLLEAVNGDHSIGCGEDNHDSHPYCPYRPTPKKYLNVSGSSQSEGCQKVQCVDPRIIELHSMHA